jgi:hypothetical protein
MGLVWPCMDCCRISSLFFLQLMLRLLKLWDSIVWASYATIGYSAKILANIASVAATGMDEGNARATSSSNSLQHQSNQPDAKREAEGRGLRFIRPDHRTTFSTSTTKIWAAADTFTTFRKHTPVDSQHCDKGIWWQNKQRRPEWRRTGKQHPSTAALLLFSAISNNFRFFRPLWRWRFNGSKFNLIPSLRHMIPLVHVQPAARTLRAVLFQSDYNHYLLQNWMPRCYIRP